MRMIDFKPVQPTTEQVTFLKMTLSQFRFRSGQCFWNAQRAVIYTASKRLRYVEGWATGQMGEVVHHAWLLLDSSVVVELTQRALLGASTVGSPLKNRHVGVFPAGQRYRGVVFNTDEIARLWQKRGADLRLLPESMWQDSLEPQTYQRAAG